MRYTVTITDDCNNQKLLGQSWNEVSDLFCCDDHEGDLDMECAACVLRTEILDGLAHTGAYSRTMSVYSEYLGTYVNEYIAVEREI